MSLGRDPMSVGDQSQNYRRGLIAPFSDSGECNLLELYGI